jgi:hypothetical protein
MLTDLQHAVITTIKNQPYYHDDEFVNYKFVVDERRCCLRLEKKGLVKRLDKTGNYFKLTAMERKP